MSPDLIPTIGQSGMRARIIWRPVGVVAWEVTCGEHGMCSMPVYRRADKAKAGAWAYVKALTKALA
jgi:hypothetical protein